MPNKPSAIKALNQAKKATLKHDVIKTKLRNLEKRIKKGLEKKDTKIVATLAKEWQKACDKAKKAKAVKGNTANRMKSRFMKKINSLK
ncbi:MAG TPA: 30S ribosomal protein S20 [Candidatus Magasanikbacteria bacterium]|nr:30S ribosomal protein S20 [Candidatus Magasanikbacteria bacterium]